MASGIDKQDAKIKVLFVCMGNICRSPVAEGTFLHMVKERGLEDLFEIDSSGTHAYHAGEKPNERSVSTANKHGISLSHQARVFTPDDFSYYDYILVMDEANRSEVIRQARSDSDRRKVLKYRALDPTFTGDGHPPDVADPYYGKQDGFEEVQLTFNRTSEPWIDWMLENRQS